MSSAAVTRDYDLTDVPSIVRHAILLGAIEAVFVVVMSFVTRLLGGVAELAVGGLIVFAGLMIVAGAPGLWTRARTIEGIAGSAGIGLAAAWVFLLIDVALLQPLGIWTNRWHALGGGSNWWYHPVWWMLGAFLPWMGAWLLASQTARRGAPSLGGMAVTTLVCTVVIMAAAVLLHVPGAAWGLGTFGVSLIAGLTLATTIAVLGSRRA